MALANILIVDDDELTVESLGERLSSEGFQIFSALGGIEALEIIAQEPVDLVTLGIHMPPGIDGIEVLKIIREFLPDLPVIIITGDDRLQLKRECFKLGANDYFNKPLDDIKLLDSIHSILTN